MAVPAQRLQGVPDDPVLALSPRRAHKVELETCSTDHYGVISTTGLLCAEPLFSQGKAR